MRGLFITVEGLEGSGKTTLVQALAHWLREQGYSVCVTAEPGSSPLGKWLRDILLQGEERTAWAEVFLFLADRAEHVAKVIRPALERGEIVLCDRFTDSTLAYQGFGLGLPVETLRELNRIATNGLMPDLTLLLDVFPEVGLQRSQQATVFERRQLPFHQRVRWGYLRLAQKEPLRIKCLDANQPVETVIAEAQRWVEEAVRQWRWLAS